MNPNDDNWDEKRLAAMFVTANTDASPPDKEFLQRLRERSTEVFAAAAPQQTTLPPRRRKMSILAIRTLAASAVATVIAATALFWSSVSPGDSNLEFGKVLEKVARADTVHLEITRGGKASEAWAGQPNRFRLNNPDGTYKIARGGRLWSVDEQANRATSRASTSYRVDRKGDYLLSLLELSLGKQAAAEEYPEVLLSSRPVERVRRGGLDCNVYRAEVPATNGKFRIEAVVDARTQLLQSLEATLDRGSRTVPVAKIRVLAVDPPVDEDLFVVGDTLTEDGRVGKVTDAQGIVSVKPVMHRRWTPVAAYMLLKPGDWLRTDNRGANAVRFRLVKQTDVTLGPGSLAEVVRPNLLRLFSGELKVTADAAAPLELTGPGDERITVKGTQIYRLQNEKLVQVKQAPLWLAGFEGTTSNESIGSLIAKVEGRNVPLTVGYHKVSVDVRDQIARTVIEESFVNHTKHVLEGVFHFPLPQDASISGFGMWIGDELVEADVVEKQRAREIYETILREKRDPGLLEWAGGNIFKARVYPIPGRSEKRIKITYTQVLPLKGNRYRYSYSLQSEMLKQHPLRELAIDVKINSAAALANVSSPTHMTRIDRTPHSAHVEFTAQDYTPSRDFEVVVEMDDAQADVVLIPHRRGDDGYFMMQLTPPAASDTAGEGDWQREILPNTGPMELLILADTSASIDDGGRSNQADLVASLLGSLTPEDKFNLAGCDVECDWVFKKALPANEKNIEAARQFLADRISLGWTDLDKAFASAMKQSGPKSHVVYIGDGIVTGTDVDPVAFGKRLRRLYQGQTGTFHAITVSSSFEPVVIKTIASLGGGSFRQISGEHGPQAVALELLGEISQPTIRDLKVEFRGLRAARVYPEELPNLSAGTQQILLGRYLPEGQDQQGEVIVSGRSNGQPVTFRARVSLPNNDAGNSFIPRLWARVHLDALLVEGTSQTIKDEIIALSEEYHIMTPYTSLLVLESDADRERFEVTRRFQMRDGEKFFAEGRDNVDYELVQQQMKRAGNWRLGLRRSVLGQLVGMGRNAGVFQTQNEYAGSRGRDYYYAGDRRSGALDLNGDWGGGGGFGGFGPMSGPVSTIGGDLSAGSWSFNGNERLGDDFDDLFGLGEKRDAQSHRRFDSIDEIGFELAQDSESFEGEKNFKKKSEMLFFDESADIGATYDGAFRGAASASRPRRSTLSTSFDLSSSIRGLKRLKSNSEFFGYKSRISRELGAQDGLWASQRQPSPQYTQWLGTLFPQVPTTPAKEEPFAIEHPWPAEARALVKNLLRSVHLAGLESGLKIERRTEQFDARWGNQTSGSRSLALVSPKQWLIRTGSDGSQTTVSWCDDQQRGVFSREFQLGRVRASAPLDLSKPPLELEGYLLGSINRTYRAFSAELSTQANGQTLLVLKHPSNPKSEVHVTVDTDRWVILKIERRLDSRATSTITFSDFVDVDGGWKATRIETTDKQGRRNRLTTMKFTPLAADAFERQLKSQLADREQVQLLRQPPVEVNDAKRAIQNSKATFDDQMAMLLHFAQSQQWTRVMEHLERAEQLTQGKPGMRWVRDAILNVGRRREELKGRIVQRAAEIAKRQASGGGEGLLAEYLRGQASGFMQANEMLALLDTLKPVYERQSPYLQRMKTWNGQRVNYLRQTGQADVALRLQEQLATEYPHDYGLQQQYAQALANSGDHAAAYAWLRRVLTEDAKWQAYEEQSLRNTFAQLLRSQGRFSQLVEFLAESIEREPGDTSVYQQYLSALVKDNQIDKANTLIAQWLEEGRRADKLGAAPAARLSAAVYLALGQGYNLYTDRIDERWFEPLAETVLFFFRHDSGVRFADQVMNYHRFQQSDQCRRIRKQVAGILAAEIDTLTPDQVQRFVNWIWPNDPVVEASVWQKIADRLQRRWSAQSDPEIKHQLAQTLVKILSGRLTAVEHIAFLRLQLQQGPEKYRIVYTNQLFNTLLAQPWSAEYEDEAFGLFEKLSDAEELAERLVAHAAALYRLTDRMVKARYDARMAKVEHQEELTRTELREKKLENLQSARRGFADRLQQEMRKRTGAIVAWLNAERIYLDVLAERNLDKVAQECWEFLGPKPPQPVAEPTPEDVLEEILRTRYLLTLGNLAARKGAEPALANRLFEYTDAAIAANPKAVGWKAFKYQMLVALDRAEQLEANLRVGRAGENRRGDQALRGGRNGQRTRAGRVSHAGRLVHGRRSPRRARAGVGLGIQDHARISDEQLALPETTPLAATKRTIARGVG